MKIPVIMDSYLRIAKVAEFENVSTKSKAYFRKLAEFKELRENAKPVICIELACLFYQHECNRSFFVKLSACTSTSYSKSFNIAVKVLQIKSTSTLKDFCSIFSLDSVVDKFNSIQAKVTKSHFHQSILTGSLFISCCFIAKLSIDRKKVAYLSLCSLKELEDNADVVLQHFKEAIQDEFINTEENCTKRRKEINKVQPAKFKPALYSMIFPWKGFQKSHSYSTYLKWKASIVHSIENQS